MRNGTVIASQYLNNGLTHSQTLLPLIRRVLDDAGVSPDQIDRVGVAVGPGSFTGIKIAVATAKGFSHFRKIPCAPVSSLAALVNGISFDGTVCAVEDARRGMLYNANFAGGKRLCADRQISAEDLIRTANPPLLFCGDGTELALKAAAAAGIEAYPASADRHLIRAEQVAILAEEMPEDQLVPPEQLSPAYLRLPQAERERNEKEIQNGKEVHS